MFSKMYISAVLAVYSLSTPAVLAAELKLADFQPPTHFVVDKVYKPFAERISSETSGEVTVTLYMGGELGPGPGEQYNRVVDGVADIAFSLPGYTASNFPKTLLTELPGVIDPATGTDRILETIDMLDEEYRRVVLVGLWNNAPNVFLMGEKPIRQMNDLKGLKIRVPSRNSGLVVEAWGATPVSMPAPEIYNAMQTGVIDGAMTDVTTLGAFRLREVTNYITMGMETSISDFFLVMNRDSFNDLTDEQQQVVLAAGQEASRNGHDAWEAVAENSLADFESTEGKEVINLSPEAAAEFNAASATVVETVIAETEAKGIEAKAYVAALKGN